MTASLDYNLPNSELIFYSNSAKLILIFLYLCNCICSLLCRVQQINFKIASNLQKKCYFYPAGKWRLRHLSPNLQAAFISLSILSSPYYT